MNDHSDTDSSGLIRRPDGSIDLVASLKELYPVEAVQNHRKSFLEEIEGIRPIGSRQLAAALVVLASRLNKT